MEDYLKLTELFDQLAPLITACRYERWLLLEDVLSDSICRSEFLVVALVLRTMIEELRVMNQIAQLDNHIHSKEPTKKLNDNDFSICRKYATWLTRRILPRIKPSPFDDVREDELRISSGIAKKLAAEYKQLNDYVHPNYGSHVAVLMPHSSSVGKILINALLSIYAEFLNLVNGYYCADFQASGSEIKKESRHLSTWENTLKKYIKRTVPAIECSVAKHGYPPGWKPMGQNEIQEIYRNRFNFEYEVRSIVRQSTSLVEPAIRELTEFYAIVSKNDGPIRSVSQTFEFLTKSPHLGLDCCRRIFEWAGAVRNSKELENQFREVGTVNCQVNERYQLLQKSIELTVSLNTLKATVAFQSAVHMKNGFNVLGVALCVRSIIEHLAVNYYVTSELNRIMAEIEKQDMHDEEFQKAILDFEMEIVQYLAGTQGTSELATVWREKWLKLADADNLSIPLNKPVEAFARYMSERGHEATILYLYRSLSKIVHGEIFRGGDLIRPGCDQMIYQFMGQQIRALVNLMDDMPSDMLSQMAIQYYLMERVSLISKHCVFRPKRATHSEK
ncbi:hypothetical protein LLE49_24165 [Alicyclobacillus tolerans]|uniref:hypothetical protein n=1 Tax=Alicyclobacillus tolerans TaxID=90970 RepID=UPI001F2E3845|nr:hypothetical protein [Alicyclobacillus tolerans]MCF8567820.1 hypothetical protein [Alicyclobacillus tolerans]